MALSTLQRLTLNLFSQRQPEFNPDLIAPGITGVLDGTESQLLLGDLIDSFSGAASTRANITLLVASGGSDTPSKARPATIVGGDYTAVPFATLQGAVDSLPKFLRHSVRIVDQVGVTGAILDNFFSSSVIDATSKLPTRGRITIVGGTPSLATVATGTNTGTATGGGSGVTSFTGTSFVDSGQAWTTSDLKNKWLRTISGPGSSTVNNATFRGEVALAPIHDNTSTSLNLSNGAPLATPTSATHYQIVNLSTVYSTALPYVTPEGGTNPCILVTNCSADIMFYGLEFNNSTGNGILAVNCSGTILVTACSFKGASNQVGFLALFCTGLVDLEWSQFVGNKSANFLNCESSNFNQCLMTSCTAPVTWQDCKLANNTGSSCDVVPTGGFMSFFHCLRAGVFGSSRWRLGTGPGATVAFSERVYFSTCGVGGSDTAPSDYGLRLNSFCNVRVQTAMGTSNGGTLGHALLDGKYIVSRAATVPRFTYNNVHIDTT